MFRYLPPAAAPIRSTDWLMVFQSNPWDVQGREHFETELKDYFNVPAVYAVQSGRTALRLILEVIKNSPTHSDRTEIILPAYTCPVLVPVIQDAGLKPVLCDLVPESQDINLDNLESQMSSKTLAVIHIHPFGLPRQVDQILELTTKYGSLLIEDACQAMGAELEGKKIGSHGAFGFASFGPGKPMNLGGGGALLVNDPAWVEFANEIINDQNHIQLTPQTSIMAASTSLVRLALMDRVFRPTGWWVANRLGINRAGDDPRNWGFQFQRLSSSQSIMGLQILNYIDELNHLRREVGHTYHQELINFSEITLIPNPPSSSPIYLRFPILVENLELRESIFTNLRKNNIGVGKLYQRSLAKTFPELATTPFSGAKSVANQLLTLPTHSFVHKKDIVKIITIISNLISKDYK